MLSHLTSRPGVQSTLILSRKDGSIIQSTGLLASNSSSSSSNNPRGNGVEPSSSTTTSDSGTTSHERTNSSSSSTTQQQPYRPSQGEALAAHIHAFVTSAAALSHSLSHPPSANGNAAENGYGISNGVEDGIGSSSSSNKNSDDAEAEHHEREEDDEVKLLRLRTKKHEIVVVPDRKYLLCVVHDSSEAASSRSG